MMEGATRAVDKMENSIQNIILQEMEALEGIMIATTNLTANLDKAFERRFLYKIQFNRPTVAEGMLSVPGKGDADSVSGQAVKFCLCAPIIFVESGQHHF